MTALAALQDCLAAEHAAIYGYGVLGGVLGGDSNAASDQALAAGRTAYATSFPHTSRTAPDGTS